MTTTNPGDALSRRQKFLYILLLGALTALGPFTVDLYLPAFPALEASLGVDLVARKEGRVQLTPAGEEALPHLMSIAAGVNAIHAIRTRQSESMSARAPR